MNPLLFFIGTPEIIILFIAFGFGLPLILAIYCLLDITRSTFQDSTNKIIWAIIVLLAPLLGALAYIFWGRDQKTTTS